MQSRYIERLWRTAIRSRLTPVMVIYFSDVDITAEVRFTKGRR